jgi:hypothetical protein
MFRAAVGHSVDPDSLSAIAEVLDECRLSLHGEKPQAGVLFAGIDFDYALILQHIQTLKRKLRIFCLASPSSTDGF